VVRSVSMRADSHTDTGGYRRKARSSRLGMITYRVKIDVPRGLVFYPDSLRWTVLRNVNASPSQMGPSHVQPLS
jgi:hypothetical protein